METDIMYTNYMRAIDRNRAIELRIKSQLSYGAISKILKVPKSTLSYWLKEMPLSTERMRALRRDAWSKGEASREKYRKTMRRKREARDLEAYNLYRAQLGNLSEQTLFVAGLVLYLAEGDKKNDYSVGLANTDPEVIVFFLWWLKMYLDVPKSKIRIQLHLYETMNIPIERKFWKKKTDIPAKQFYKDQVRIIRPGSFSYPESFRHGTCKVYVHGRAYKSKIMLSIKAFLDTYNELRP